LKDASIKEIRKAYKQLALTMHPDKSDDPNAHEKFSEITRIYETLKDDELRKKYDRHGFITSTLQKLYKPYYTDFIISFI